MTKEKNRLLKIAKQSIPYIKELKKLPNIKTTNACILMQQIEYWMNIKPKGFFKFLAPPSSVQYAYKIGDSWTEELGISEDEFRTAYKQIGISYCSKKAYDYARMNGDVFQGKYYCSYFDKISRLTHYFRNNGLVNETIQNLPNTEKEILESEYLDTGSPTKPVPRDGKDGFTELEFIDSESTENTTKNTQDITNEREALSMNNISSEGNSSSKDSLNVKEEASAFNVTKSSESSAMLETKILIPEDFKPTLDAQFQASIKYPNKSQSFATGKFIKHFQQKKLKKTVSDWHDAWENWIHTERPSYDNESLEEELHNIKIMAWDVIWDVQNSLPRPVYHVNEVISLANQRGLSKESVEEILHDLVRTDNLARIEDYYYSLGYYEENEEWRAKVNRELVALGLTVPSKVLRPYGIF